MSTLAPRISPSGTDPQDSEEPVVSVVIPCLNEAENIEACVVAAMEAIVRMGVSGEVVSPPAKPIGDVRWRDVCTINGRVRSLRVQPWANVASLEAVVVDETGGLVLVFLGRRSVAGVDLGRRLVAAGRVGQHRGYLAILNPWFELK